MAGRRSADDAKWKEAKRLVAKRDSGNCRLLRVISARDAGVLCRNARQQLQTVDPAHIYPVSKYIRLTYEPDNIVSLNRYSHEMLDTCRDPITGGSISKDDVYVWWEKIAGKAQWERLQALLEGEQDE